MFVYRAEFSLKDNSGFFKLVKLEAKTIDGLFKALKEQCNKLYVVDKGIIRRINLD